MSQHNFVGYSNSVVAGSLAGHNLENKLELGVAYVGCRWLRHPEPDRPAVLAVNWLRTCTDSPGMKQWAEVG